MMPALNVSGYGFFRKQFFLKTIDKREKNLELKFFGKIWITSLPNFFLERIGFF